MGFAGEISAAEIADAWNYVISREQRGLIEKKIANLMPVKITKNMNDGSKETHIVIGNRIKNFL